MSPLLLALKRWEITQVVVDLARKSVIYVKTSLKSLTLHTVIILTVFLGLREL
jgi:hypothetical protein